MAINEVIIHNFKVLKNDADAAGLEGFEMDIFSPSVKCNKLKCCANSVFLIIDQMSRFHVSRAGGAGGLGL